MIGGQAPSDELRDESLSACRETRRAHLVGIAGSGMRALAEVLLGRGWLLSGSDLEVQRVAHLATDRLWLCRGHAAEHLAQDTDLVVYSDAVPADNPELRRAAELGLPAVSYFQMLGRLMSERRGLAVAGAHGKSTATAMAAEVLVRAGLDPTVLCGATPLGHCSGGRAGNGPLMLVEACEYRANFLHLRPKHAVILGIEPDHFDCYDSAEALEDAFAQFAQSVPSDGLLLARYDCPATQRVIGGLACRVETFGIDRRADWSAQGLIARSGCYTFDVARRGRRFCGVNLHVPGRHNVLNALAAAALASENGVAADRIAEALGQFRGLHRRLEILGTFGGVLLLDDYAHHPTEVAASLTTVRQLAPGRRVWCVFQPHQVSRTEHLLGELAASLQNADRVLVAEIFRAREGPPRPGEVTAADLARAVRRGGVEVPECHTLEEIARLLKTRLVPGDVLVTMGAGDVWKVCDGWIEGTGHRPVAA
ncbi:MAG TPA: UDP-N-acetylmuramate--L-alanine ligase [Thermoguttaceae bacterium]|nr:UDP-N-acetylmuramate--L-alanine ligase [Thermoguttaceae bacterium]